MKYSQAIRYWIIGLLSLGALVPLIVSSELYFPFIVGKNVYFRVLVELATVLWIILALTDSRYRPKKSPILLAMSVFVVLLLVSAITGVDTERSIWSDFERMDGWVGTFHLFLYFVVLGSTLIADKEWKFFWHSTLVVSGILSFVTCLKGIGFFLPDPDGRVELTFGNPIYLAVYALLHVYIALVYFVRSENIGSRIGYGILALLNVGAIFFTQTRGTILALGVSILVTTAVYAFFGKDHKFIRRFSVAALSLVIILCSALYVARDSQFVTSNPILSRVTNISLTEGTLYARFVNWSIAYESFKQKPILGWGQENYLYAFAQNYDPRMYGQEPWFDRTHNVFLDWLIAGGILGLLSYLAIYVCALWQLWSSTTCSFAEKGAYTGLFVGYFVHNLAVFDSLTSVMIVTAVLAHIHSHSARPIPALHDRFKVNFKDVQELVLAIAVVGLVAIVWINSVTLRGNAALLQAVQAPVATDKLTHFRRALEIDSPIGRRETREQLLQQTSVVRPETVAQDVKTQFLALADTEFQKLIAENPTNIRLLTAYSSFLLQWGVLDQAEQILLRARELSPDRQITLYMLGTLYDAQSKFVEARDVFKIAYDADTRNARARSFYVAELLKTGSTTAAKNLVALGVIPEQILINAYIKVEDYKGLAEILTKAIEEDPTNIQNIISLSAAYFQSGNKQAAIDALKKLVELDPKYAPDVEAITKDIQSGKNPIVQ